MNDNSHILTQTLEIIILKKWYTAGSPQSRSYNIYDLATRLFPAKLFLARNVRKSSYCVREELALLPTHIRSLSIDVFPTPPYPIHQSVENMSVPFLTIDAKDWQLSSKKGSLTLTNVPLRLPFRVTLIVSSLLCYNCNKSLNDWVDTGSCIL